MSDSELNKPRSTRRRLVIWGAVIAVALAGTVYALGGGRAFAQIAGHTTHMHGAHDMANMPGLRGVDATQQETDELAIMFNNFSNITREVTNLPNGIRTVTASYNEEVMAALVSHVAGMIGRVEDGRDPQIFIQSPTLDILFERGAAIVTDIEVTDAGIVVTQTSDDPQVVAALHTHAAEVTDLANRGMEAVHESMAQRVVN
ncbi:hypothetical protein [Yoonia sp.]|jgi:hypothetical protein|uniref:hypothetical protein n=1 Tax=Yoonia sp. TaxID=2212373 RepID=UPI0025EBB430|nr:hypothetical protein [Yoonia sp.]